MKSAVPVFISIAKFGISAAFNMVFLAFVALTPVQFTSSMFGLANFVARWVTFLAPLTAELEDKTGITINIICAFFASIVSLCLLVKLPRFV